MVNDEVIKCICCGQINIIDEAKQMLKYEEKEDWTIRTTETVHRKFKEMCGKKGMDFNDGLLYLLGLHVKQEWGRQAQNVEVPFGTPGTGK